MEELLNILVKQIKVELGKSYPATAYNPRRNSRGRNKQYSGPYRKTYRGTLSDSVRGEVVQDDLNGDLKGVIVLADYYQFVDRGRKPGKYPPLEMINDWVRGKSGTFPGLSVEQTSFLVRRSIAEKGIGGINFINNAIDNVIDRLVEEGEDELLERFEEFIDDKLLTLSSSEFNLTYNQ